MRQLKSANLFTRIGTYFFPKNIDGQVRSELLPTGQVQVTPFFVIDGQEVPCDLVTLEASQTILGHNVVLSEAARSVLQATQGKPTRLAKKKAASMLTELGRSGASMRSKDGTRQPRIEQVKPDVTLELGPNDSLTINSELVTTGGVVIDKPLDITDLQAEDGWFSVGDDLLQVVTTNTPLDQVLIQEGGNRTLSGESVPQTLKLIQKESKKIGSIEKSESLRPLSVFTGHPENQVRVDGDSDSITISPTLVMKGPTGTNYEPSNDEIDQVRTGNQTFTRVKEGWLELPKVEIERFDDACEEIGDKLGNLTEIRGNQIPAALAELLRATGRNGPLVNPWAVYFSDAVKNSHRIVDTPADVKFRMSIVESDGRSLLSLDPLYNHDRFLVTHEDTQQAAEVGDQWIRRPGSWIKIDLAKFNRIKAEIERLQLQPGKDGYTFPASQREKVLQVFSLLGSIEHSEAYATFVVKLSDFEKIEETPLPMQLRPEVEFRTYQQHGYNWLAFLHRFGLNGILADDMGLGKTLQTLAVIQRAREQPNAYFPSLVICPTSVVNNWKSEIAKFLQESYVVIYSGNNRDAKLRQILETMKELRSRTVPLFVITSYDIARRDHEQLNRVPWLYVVVDEGHNIKNPDAERTKAIKTIHGQHKLALTGTPIQNNLEELWSLFDYAMPGFLGTRSEFRQKYAPRGNRRLKDRIHPFILRRLKSNVAKDLPSKTIIELKVELTPKQTQLYKAVSNSAEVKKLVDEVGAPGAKQAPLQILAALTKLRNICNHPVLASANARDDKVSCEDSGKLEALKELIEEVVGGEHRTLLFSQTTRMLDIIESLFTKWNVRSLRLDGSTPPNQRPAIVDEFNTNSAVHCFLISTKAGGTGLNLTGADTVIFYDHDWNPANDNQAQDRAYRIGQTKPVTVYKLISKGTIEEKIIERQRIKQTLADEIIGADEDGFKDLTKEDLLSLFTLDESKD